MSLLSRLAVTAARAYGILSSNPNNVSADYLVVAGGGAGAFSVGGGGGAGGLLTSTATLSTLNTYSITVGAGGASVSTSGGGPSGSNNGYDGSNSVISGTGLTTITSTGGGGGGSFSSAGRNGGSGGGGGGNNSGNPAGGTGTSGQGNNGGSGIAGSSPNRNAGGGGGASAVGANATSGAAGNGGAGTASSISGSSVTYAGGGGGGTDQASGPTAGTGGSGGGGNGGSNNGTGSNATVNTGGGGGGASGNVASGAGGSGIVIISYTSATPKFVGGTITTSGGKQIHTFTSSGTLSPITPITASYLVVAGGGGGGNNGGAGAGGLLTNSTTLYSGATYVVTVGAGGAGAIQQSTGTKGTAGSDSSLSGTGLTTITSTGGGYGAGGDTNNTGGNGGSGGGGAGSSSASGTGTSGQGYNGGNGGSNQVGGGGGGSGGAGGNGTVAAAGAGGIGGVGTASSITGTSVTYASGGGGAGGQNGGTGGSASAGGGGSGGNGGASATAGGSGTPNSGGGGGGGGTNGDTSPYPRLAGGAGGSGIVIISYAGSQVFNGGLVTTSGGNTIHTFTSTGALTPLTNNLNNSLRFRSSNSNYLSRTPTVAGNQQKWTWSGWVKRGTLGGSAANILLGVYYTATDATSFYISFLSSDQLSLGTQATDLRISNQLFRDPSAWYHIVVALDTPNATAQNRLRAYVNGNEITSWATNTTITQNTNYGVNITQEHDIGRRPQGASLGYFDGYMTDINFIDGQALEPYYFGNNDANGVWKPIQYKGTYGTNGFYLTFGNTTSTTTLGYDSSPNGNNWTCNNISLTAGTTYDAMLDVPTNTSATVANYCVINPLSIGSSVTISNGNLTFTNSATGHRMIIGSMAISSGKWYAEFTVTSLGGTYPQIGIIDITQWVNDSQTGATSRGWSYLSDGRVFNNNSAIDSGEPTYTTGDIIGVAFDLTNNKVYFSKNGTFINSADPAAGTNGYSITAGYDYAFSMSSYDSGTDPVYNLNFGQRPFAYTPPTGFIALNTYNLPTPTILQGNKYMDATLWTGTATTQVVVNNSQFKPDFVWMKSRSGTYNNWLFDSNRGTGKLLASNLTDAESNYPNILSAFNSNGFTTNSNGVTDNFVAWQWQAGQGSTSSNTDGSITSTVSVNTTAGFSVVTYTGTGANATVGHGLGVAPKMIIVKKRSGANDWVVYTKEGVPNAGYYLRLNLTNGQTYNTAVFQGTHPTSTVFSIGTDIVNDSSGTYVAYCWAAISGFSAFGSYTGNGSADGPFVYLGFRPKYVMVKKSSSTGSWAILDTARNPYNVANTALYADLSNAENSIYEARDYLSNGFKLRTTDQNSNENGASYIYMAFAENPFKNANAR